MPTTSTTCSMPFGKHKGKPLEEVPYSYLEWLVQNVTDDHWQWLVREARRELDYRDGVQPSQEEYDETTSDSDTKTAEIAVKEYERAVKETVAAWYRRMSLKYHPDRGGSKEAQAALNDAYETLRESLDLT